MGEIAIRVENIGKRYRIGGAQTRYKTLRESLISVTSAPIRWLKGQRREKNTFWALQDISLEIKQGEVVGIIGRNGAGKSTLLKILSRITKPTTGRVDLYGRVGSLLEVGTGFSPELTGRDNIFLNGAILGMNRQEIIRKFDEIVAFAEIGKFLDTQVKFYSSGMYVRLAFAVAAHLEPEILMVDEVLAVGDAQFQKKCLGKMGNVAKEGRTVLFVSHNLIAVQTLCQRAFWLDAGLLKAQGAVSQIATTYLRSGLVEDNVSERVWTDITCAPGNETVRLHRISVQPEDGKPGDLITMQTPLHIEVDYWNLLPMVHLHATLLIYNEQGILAFTTGAFFDSDPILHDQPPIGLYRSVYEIPGDFLNNGFYRVTLNLLRFSAGNDFEMEDAIEFEVIDNTQRKYAWFGKEPGVVAPRFTWHTHLLDSTGG